MFDLCSCVVKSRSVTCKTELKHVPPFLSLAIFFSFSFNHLVCSRFPLDTAGAKGFGLNRVAITMCRQFVFAYTRSSFFPLPPSLLLHAQASCDEGDSCAAIAFIFLFLANSWGHKRGYLLHFTLFPLSFNLLVVNWLSFVKGNCASFVGTCAKSFNDLMLFHSVAL